MAKPKMYGPQERVSLPVKDQEKIGVLAEQMAVSRSAVIRMLVREALELRERQGARQTPPLP